MPQPTIKSAISAALASVPRGRYQQPHEDSPPGAAAFSSGPSHTPTEPQARCRAARVVSRARDLFPRCPTAAST